MNLSLSEIIQATCVCQVLFLKFFVKFMRVSVFSDYPLSFLLRTFVVHFPRRNWLTLVSCFLCAVPPGDEGWLCPVCLCKLECIDVVNAYLGSNFEVENSWEVGVNITSRNFIVMYHIGSSVQVCVCKGTLSWDCDKL